MPLTLTISQPSRWIKNAPAASRHAFTLLELVLVLAIIAIALLASAPSLGSFVRGRSPSDAAAEFINLTHWVRSQSITDGVIMRINLDATNGRWWITQQQGTDFVQSTAPLSQDFTLPDGIHLNTDAPKDGTTQYIEFEPTGQTTPATLQLTSGGDPITITAESPLDLFHVLPVQGSAP